MDRDHQWGLAGFAFGTQQPAVDVVPIGMGNDDAFNASLEWAEPSAPIVGEPTELIVLNREDVGRPGP
jgi:hypothetical protein